MKRNPLTLTIAGLLIIVFGLMLFVFQVRQSQVAVVTLFEKQNRVITNAGAYLKWPWPVENVYYLDSRVHTFEDQEDEVVLNDQNIIGILVFTGWRIDDPSKFFPKFLNGSIDEAQRSLESIVRSAKQDIATKHNFADFLSADPRQMKFTQIEDEMLALVRQRVQAANYGVAIEFVQIKNLGLPSSVTARVFERMKAERTAIIDGINADATTQSSTIRAKADSDAAKLLYEGDAMAKEIRGEGEAQSLESLEVMGKNPDFAKFITSLDILEEVSKQNTVWVMNPSFRGLELLQGAKPAGAADNGLLQLKK